jgi:ATP-dependent DNA helicase MPH1
MYIKQCSRLGIFHGSLDPVTFHPFRAKSAMDEVNARSDRSQLNWVYPVLSNIGALARAMGYLVRETILPCGSMLMDHQLESSFHMCFHLLTEEAEGAASDKPSALSKDPAFQTLMTELRLQKSNGFAIHPKMEMLKTLVIDHFGKRWPDDDASNVSVQVSDDTRAIVFATFREAVDEIVDFLNQESPLLRATKFIGQGIDKKGNKGLAQREQGDVSPNG